MSLVPPTTPAGVNLVRNPSAEVDTWGTNGGAARSTERGWSGGSSYKFTFTNPGTGGDAGYFVFGTNATDCCPVVPGQSYQVAFRWFADNANVKLRCSGMNFMTAAGNDFLNGVTLNSSGDGQLFGGSGVTGTVNDWNEYQRATFINSLVAPATAVGGRIYIAITMAAAVTGTVNVWIDGVHMAPAGDGEFLPYYIDGDGGAGFAWDGTAHRSTSRRLAMPTVHATGDGGEVAYRTRYYRATKDNVLGDEITASIAGGTVEIDLDRAVQGTCKLQALDATAATQWSWVAVFCETEEEDGTTDRVQRGLFRLDSPRVTGNEMASTIEVSGLDVSVLIDSYRFVDTYNVPLGTNVQTALVTLLALCGITRHAIPATTRTTGKVRTYPPGTKITEAFLSLTTAMGWHPVYATPDGRVTTRAFRALDKTTPTRTFTLGRRSQLVGDIVTQRDYTSFANQVIATRENPTLGTTLKAISENTDIRSLGSTTNPAGPGVVAVELKVSEEVDQTGLQKLADEERARRNVVASAQIQSMPDFGLDVHDVVRMTADTTRYPHLSQANGDWYVQQIAHGLTASTAVMTVKMRRSEVL